MSAARTTRRCGYLNDNIRICCKWMPARWLLSIMGFFGMMNVCSLRVNLNDAIVGMVDYAGLEKLHDGQANRTFDGHFQGGNSSVTNCRRIESNNSEDSLDAPGKLFLWDENAQGLALASYDYGHICAQILGTWVARKLGRVRVWGFSMLIASMCTIFLPATLEIGFGAFVTARIVIGLFCGVSYPIMHGMWSVWAPPEERGRLLVLPFAGAPFGSVIVLPLSGMLTKEFGWPAAFYTTGTVGIAWSILWLIVIYESPAEHPRISAKEKKYIESSLGHDVGVKQSSEQQKRSVPWFLLSTSISVWSVIIPHFLTNFGPFLILAMMPTYFCTVLNFDVKSSWFLSSIPYIVRLCLFFVAGWSADLAISRGVTATRVRKIWSSIGTFLPGVALAATGYTGCNVALTSFLITVSIAVDTFNTPGFRTSMLEIAPAFAGIIYAVANTIATTSGFIAPQIAGALRKAHRDDPIQGWRALFWVCAVLNFAGGLVFLICGTSDVQDWAGPAPSDSSDEKESLAKDENVVDEVQV